MLQIDLQEYEPSEQTLTATQRDALLGDAKELKLSIEPIIGTSSRYLVTPGSTVGAVEISDMSVRIEPKIGIPQLLSLACYSMRLFRPQDEPFDFREDEALSDVLALALAAAARRAFAPRSAARLPRRGGQPPDRARPDQDRRPDPAAAWIHASHRGSL